MERDKRGAMSIEMIIAVLIAVVVLLVVVVYFTQTFKKATGPIEEITGSIEKAVECNKLCDQSDQKYCTDKCDNVPGVSCNKLTCP